MTRFRDTFFVSYNYEQCRNGLPTQVIRVAELDGNLNPMSDRELSLRPKFRVNEDMRLFVHDQKLCGVYYEGTVHERGAGLVIVSFDERLNVLERFEPRFSRARRVERNWQFFSHGGEMLCVYSVQ